MINYYSFRQHIHKQTHVSFDQALCYFHSLQQADRATHMRVQTHTNTHIHALRS